MTQNELDPLIKLLGGHDLKFALKSWSIFLSDANNGVVESGHDSEIKPDHMIVLNGTFQNMNLWEGEVTVRINSHHSTSIQGDKNGNICCGIIEWASGFSEGKDLGEFKDGNVTVRAAITQDTFKCALILLQSNQSELQTSFRLLEMPQHWDGKRPIFVNSVHFYHSGKVS